MIHELGKRGFLMNKLLKEILHDKNILEFLIREFWIGKLQ